MCILLFDWSIALYLFISLVRNASFLIVKNSGVREEVSDVNKSLCKNILSVSSRLCTSTLGLCTSPTDTFHFTYHPFNAPAYAPEKISNALYLAVSLTSSPKIVKQESTFTFKFTLRSIYEVNGTA